MRYSAAVSVTIPDGTWSAGTEATAAAPVAATTVLARHVPRSVRTTYPPASAWTAVTAVPVSTGAADAAA